MLVVLVVLVVLKEQYGAVRIMDPKRGFDKTEVHYCSGFPCMN